MNCLDLDDELGDVDLLLAVENAFDIILHQDDVEHMETVGELYDCVADKLGAKDGRRPVCFTAVSFYRLRCALFEITGRQGIHPKTPLRELFPGGKIGRAEQELEQLTDMKLPGLPTGSLDIVLILVIAIGSPFAAIGFWESIGAWSLLALLGWGLLSPLGWILARFPRGTIPAHCPDVGSFARAMAGLNYGTLSQEYGVNNRTDVWNSFVEVIRNNTGFENAIDRETTFFPAAP